MALNRQDSASSASSGATGMSAASSLAADGGDGVGGPGDLASEASNELQKALFGALLTLHRERWEDSKRFLAGRVVLEHLQLVLVLLQAQFLWTFDTTYWAWRILNFSLLKILTVPGGPTTYAAVVYVFVAVAGATLAACAWVSYTFVKNTGVVPNKWPVKLLRLVMVVFYKVCYVTVLNYLLGPLNCGWLARSSAHVNADFPTQNCMAMPHLALEVVAAVGCVIVIAMAGLLALADVTPNPVSQNWLATAHSGVEVKAWGFKTAIVLAANVLAGFGQLQAMLIMIAAGWTAYVHVRYQPYVFEWMNHLRAGLYAMTAHVSLLLTISAFDEAAAAGLHLSPEQLLAVRQDRSERLTFLMLVLLPASLAAGAAVSWLRLHLWVRPVLRKFRAVAHDDDGVEASVSLKDVHKFVDEYEVELVARCCRTWLDYEDNILDPAAIALADHVVKAGLARFPHSAHMTLIFINFLASVQNNQQSCNSQLQVARKLEAGWCDRYVFFVREQQQLALLRANAGQNTGAESAVDLVGYVEFTRAYRQVLRAHKAALYAIRGFWKQLLHNSVPFTGIVHAFGRIEKCRAAADHTYRTMLERYPSNVKVLRAYARFLEDVCSDPWAASRFFAEADRLEEGEGADDGCAADLGGAAGLPPVGNKNTAMCVINAQGIIQMANKPALKLFGYRKGEIEGKNISLLMPQPFSGRHNGYLRNYVTTGKARILNTVREVVGLHKERYVFPLSIEVTKASGAGAEAIFAGVLRLLPDDPGTVRAWLMPAGGIMLCVDMRFADWFGLLPGDCLGRPFTSLAVDADVLSGLMEAAAAATPEDFEAGQVAVKDVLLSHKFAEPLRVDISLRMGGTDAERLYVAVIRKRACEESEHLMVTDKRGRITYATSKLATLLGVSHPKALIRTEFTRFMAQPFMQLHARWMKDMPSEVPLCSCRNGAPVVLITQQRTPVPAKLVITSREQGDEVMFVVKVTPTVFSTALMDRRLSLRIDAHGDIQAFSATPAMVFGFSPALLVGRNLSHCLDVFTGLPATGGLRGLDMEHVLTELVHKAIEHKESSWRCGLHPPMTAAEVAAAQANVLQANMLASQTKAALLQLEVVEADDERGGIASITAHLWRAEMLTGVVEVNKEALVSKVGCCPLHQPGPLFGVPSSALLHTNLSRWLSVPASYDGLLLESKKKGGALKKKAADIKIGPLLHASGQHNDGDAVRVAVQAVVKEGTGGAGLLVVKLTVEKPPKGSPNFVRRLLGLPDAEGTPAQAQAAAAFGGADQGGGEPESDDAGSGDDVEGPGGGGAAAGNKPLRARGGVRFGAGAEEDGAADGAGDGGSEEAEVARPHKGKNERLMEWMQQASGDAGGPDADGGFEAGVDAEESQATAFLGLPPHAGAGAAAGGFGGYAAPPDGGLGSEGGSQASGGDDASSQQSGSAAGGFESDYKRGRRLRKLARMLGSRQAQKATARFYSHTVTVIALLLAAHLACFVASVVLLDAQRTYIEEVDGAGSACIAMHRMAIDCRVLDALYRGVHDPAIFTPPELEHYLELFDDAILQFEAAHEATYLGQGSTMRRFVNRKKYKLHDYWETPMWAASKLLNTTPPTEVTTNMSLWTMGNMAIQSAREVRHNHKRLVAHDHLSDSPFWHFVMANAPTELYQGYRATLFGLIERALAKMDEVQVSMVILLALKGCGLFLAATLYVCLLVRKMVAQRADLFGVFLVIPAGFLRTLAAKQVQVDEDADSDDDSDAGDLDGGDAQPQHQQQPEKQEAQKLNLSLTGGKKGGARRSAAGGKGLRSGGAPAGLLGRLAGVLNPAKWFAPKQASLDTGKRQLVRNSRDVAIVGAPFLLWGAVVIIIYATSMTQLEKIHVPFQMLNSINILVYRTTRTVLYSLEAAMAAPDPAKVRLRQAELAERLENLRQDYVSFMYGFRAVGDNAARTDLSTDRAGVFQAADLANIFFRTDECLRHDQASCYPPGHKFYAATHSGLDAMVTRLMQEGLQLVSDAPADVNITSARFEYIWQVGRKDMFDGMTTADAMFRGSVEAMFDQLRTAHVAVFVVSLVLAAALWLGLVRPMLRRAGRESRAIAEMLSQLPPEMDVEGLVAQALDAAGEEVQAAGAPLARLSGAGGGNGGKLAGSKGAGSGRGRQGGFGAPAAADELSDAGTDG